MTLTTAEAIRKYGAQAVYTAANHHAAGNAQCGLVTVELEAKNMGDVFAIQSAAYAELGDAAKAIDYAQATAALSKLN